MQVKTIKSESQIYFKWTGTLSFLSVLITKGTWFYDRLTLMFRTQVSFKCLYLLLINPVFPQGFGVKLDDGVIHRGVVFKDIIYLKPGLGSID